MGVVLEVEDESKCERREIELKAGPTRECHLHVIHTSFWKLLGWFLSRDITFSFAW